jgi:hypothetical protein
VLDAQERPEHVGVKRRGKALGGDLGERDHLTIDTGVVDRYVESPEPVDGRPDEKKAAPSTA